MPKKILIGSQKGGAGKSTLAVNIAAELARQGRDVVLLDADRQGTASIWCHERDNGLSPVHCVQRYDDVRSTVNDLAERYEIVVIDCAGRDSKEMRTAMLAADLLIVPARPSQADLDTLETMQDIISQAKDFNSDLSVSGVFTMCQTNVRVNETAESRDFVSDIGIRFCNTLVFDRKVYRDSIAESTGVTEMNANKAAEEITALLKELDV